RTLVSVITRLVADDPAHLLVQVSRRLPTSLRRQIARIEPSEKLGRTTRALIYTLADRRAEATRVLQTAPSSHVANALRIAHSMPLPVGATTTQVARQMWDNGDLTGALGTSVPTSVLRQHLQSQSRILEKQSRLRPPKTPSNQVPDGYAYQTDSSVLR